MKAIVNDRYGPPDVLELREIEKPSVPADGILVRVRASSVNPYDWHYMRGEPYLVRMEGLRAPKQIVRGVDVAGVVEEVGADVTEFRPGDEVFGVKGGAFAEYVCAGAKNILVTKPASLTFEQAGAVGIAAFTALQAVRDRGAVQAGQRVLVNGAAGGVGTFAVQIANALGAHVTGVCSTHNVDLARSIGAEDVVDYTTEDFSRRGQRYDLIVDTVGNRSISALRRALTPKGTAVLIGFAGTGKWFAPLSLPLRAIVMSRFVGQKFVPMVAKNDKTDLLFLRDLMEAGKVTPVIDRTYPLSEAAEAVRYVETKHARGKVVITI